MDDGSSGEAEVTRAPTDQDLVLLARTLNDAGVKYIVVVYPFEIGRMGK